MVEESSWLFFMMLPKWVKMRVTDAYYTLGLPERLKNASHEQRQPMRLSKAGQKVREEIAKSGLVL